MKVAAFPVTHRGPGCYGYLFEEDSRRPFLAEKAEKLGVPHGPERSLLVQGNTIRLEEGTFVEPDQVLGKEVRGTKLVHVGDAGRTENLVDVCHKADALVIESTYLARDKELADRFGHLTAAQAAKLARDAQVRHLFLVHISRRYPEYQIAQEARAIFPRTVVPRDLDHYRIMRDAVDKVEREGD